MHSRSDSDILMRFILTKKLSSFLLVAFGLISNCLAIFLSLSIGTYYETLSSHHSTKSQILHLFHIRLPHKPAHFFLLFFLLIVLASFFQFMFRYGSQRMGMQFSLSVRKKIFRHQIRMKMADFSKKTIGGYLLRYSGDIKSLQTFTEKGVFQFVSDTLFVGLSLLVLFRINMQASMYIFSGLVSGFFIMRFISSRIKGLEDKRRNMLSSQLSYVHQSFGAVQTIKTSNREYLTIKKFKEKTDILADITLRSYFWKSLNFVLPFFIMFLTLLGVFVSHPIGFAENQAQGSSFITYILLLLLLFTTAKRVMRVSAIWRSGQIAMKKIAEVLYYPLEDEQSSESYTLIKGKIEFKNVFFSYKGYNDVLENKNFTWQRGEINYLEGKGKTTIARLLLGLYEPTGGSIFIDGVDAKLFSKKSIRQHIAFLSDNSSLTGNTIYKCLHLQKDRQHKEEVQHCLRFLRFSFSRTGEEINLHTNIGNSARLLSQSDYKKLLIARTLLSKKKILLIDTLLEDVEKNVQQELFSLFRQLKKDQTIIIDSRYKSMFTEMSQQLF